MHHRDPALEPYYQREAERQKIIRENAGRRLKRMPPLPVPEKLPRPKRWQLTDDQGEYIGTWPYGGTKEDAIEEAEALGHKVGKAKQVD